MITDKPRPCGIWQVRMVALLLLGLSGCGGKYSTQRVEGVVTDPTGAPLADVMVVFERTVEPLVARGITDSKGHYRLGTMRPDEGAPVGTYRVCLSQQLRSDPDAAVPRRFATQYESPETSGIEVEVVPGQNRFDFKLDPPENK